MLLFELARNHKLKRIAADPAKVRDAIELAIQHSNENVLKARLKGMFALCGARPNLSEVPRLGNSTR